MSIDSRLLQIQAMVSQSEELLAQARAHSSSGGGGMDDRLARIEARIDRQADKLADIDVRMATLTERVAHLPGKGFIVQALIGALTVIALLVAFGEKLQALVG